MYEITYHAPDCERSGYYTLYDPESGEREAVWIGRLYSASMLACDCGGRTSPHPDRKGKPCVHIEAVRAALRSGAYRCA